MGQADSILAPSYIATVVIRKLLMDITKFYEMFTPCMHHIVTLTVTHFCMLCQSSTLLCFLYQDVVLLQIERQHISVLHAIILFLVKISYSCISLKAILGVCTFCTEYNLNCRLCFLYILFLPFLPTFMLEPKIYE